VHVIVHNSISGMETANRGLRKLPVRKWTKNELCFNWDTWRRSKDTRIRLVRLSIWLMG